MGPMNLAIRVNGRNTMEVIVFKPCQGEFIQRKAKSVTSIMLYVIHLSGTPQRGTENFQ